MPLLDTHAAFCDGGGQTYMLRLNPDMKDVQQLSSSNLTTLSLTRISDATAREQMLLLSFWTI